MKTLRLLIIGLLMTVEQSNDLLLTTFLMKLCINE